MRGLSKRLEALEVAAAPFVPVRHHLIGVEAGETKAKAIADYEATNGPIGSDAVILLCGVKPVLVQTGVPRAET